MNTYYVCAPKQQMDMLQIRTDLKLWHCHANGNPSYHTNQSRSSSLLQFVYTKGKLSVYTNQTGHANPQFHSDSTDTIYRNFFFFKCAETTKLRTIAPAYIKKKVQRSHGGEKNR